MMKKLGLIGLAALLLAGCEAAGSTASSAEGSTPKQESVAAEVKQEETKKEEVKKEETRSEVGKRSNPVPLGQTAQMPVTYYDNSSKSLEGLLDLTITDVIRGEEAWALLQNENQFNEPAPEGMEWLVFTITATLVEGSEDVAYNTVSLSSKMIASNGSEVQQNSHYASFSSSDFGWNDLYEGGTDSGQEAKLVPVGDVALLSIQNWGNPMFFAVQ